MSPPGYNADQRAALSWVTLEARDPGRWRDINLVLLSFTRLEWSPLGQLYDTIPAGLAKLGLRIGDAVALGFAAMDSEDARRLERAWRRLLSRDNDGPIPFH